MATATAIDSFEKMAYDEHGNNLCKPIQSKQNVSIKVDNVRLDDICEIKRMMKELGYEKTFSGMSLDEKYLMEFERG